MQELAKSKPWLNNKEKLPSFLQTWKGRKQASRTAAWVHALSMGQILAATVMKWILPRVPVSLSKFASFSARKKTGKGAARVTTQEHSQKTRTQSGTHERL